MSSTTAAMAKAMILKLAEARRLVTVMAQQVASDPSVLRLMPVGCALFAEHLFEQEFCRTAQETLACTLAAPLGLASRMPIFSRT
jgi:hypothetical protein